MKHLLLPLALVIVLLIPGSFTLAQDPPSGNSLDRNACYEGGFLHPCLTAYEWQAGWYLQHWIDNNYNDAVKNDLFEWVYFQFATANPAIFEDGTAATGPTGFNICQNFSDDIMFSFPTDTLGTPGTVTRYHSSDGTCTLGVQSTRSGLIVGPGDYNAACAATYGAGSNNISGPGYATTIGQVIECSNP